MSKTETSSVFKVFLAGTVSVALTIGIWIIQSTFTGSKNTSEKPSNTDVGWSGMDNSLETTEKRNAMLLNSKLHYMNTRQESLEDDLDQIKEQLETLADNKASEEEAEATPQADNLKEDNYERQYDLLVSSLQDESLDPGWSTNAGESVNDKFMSTGLFEKVETQCQSTLCKVDIEFLQGTDISNGMDTIQHNLPWNSATFAKVSNDGKQGTIFLSREGYSLPEIEI